MGQTKRRCSKYVKNITTESPSSKISSMTWSMKSDKRTLLLTNYPLK
ncbi:unnamed protein product [Oppiella nova]|uniref:Uncharacterized protein n=1 Tax=Oppiella nova TaxID=334625 RepID=A0A7R9MRW5_9ACAR|nr:unnamed protein product [Oppiella nova]CAG2182057.1 unnamed protein product [Oppiella nova]